MKKVLIIVDPLNDFITGSLAVPYAAEIIPIINKLIPYEGFDYVVIVQDWHPKKHKAFASEHPDKNVFDVINLGGVQQTLWPDHCVQGTHGAEIHKDVDMNSRKIIIFKKGMDLDVDSHSGFFDNQGNKSTGLTEFLKENGVTETFICGLATDYCVEYTALDSVKEGYKTTVIVDACRGLAEDLTPNYEKMKNKGVILLEYFELAA